MIIIIIIIIMIIVIIIIIMMMMIIIILIFDIAPFPLVMFKSAVYSFLSAKYFAAQSCQGVFVLLKIRAFKHPNKADTK